ncbi:WD domain-containing protein, G-beta repeat-containing protein [Neorhodopirellula lusitana]|uniref:WD domain-containing protein, G-beta repeat-containing protein n=1 Tax=Neorhodopirellula lusitana TaxID=445327 RepID=A0ABY1QD41_9BACT|nr:c-type cytochrome domain-containing protein [Neorhodopirellula lusitana]SMP65560.1 WD domain-containing protein, G-beta repeat-containing protein [Neorhodopirellula lusitana]
MPPQRHRLTLPVSSVAGLLFFGLSMVLGLYVVGGLSVCAQDEMMMGQMGMSQGMMGQMTAGEKDSGDKDNDAKGKLVTYDDHVAAILKKNCVTCHGDGKQEAGLNLSNYADVTDESGLVVAGRSSGSHLIDVITSTEEGERMPPEGDPLPAEAVTLIKQWIDTGLRENSGSSAASMRTLGFQATSATDETGPGAVPANLPKVTRTKTQRRFPVLALASSLRAPVSAMSGYGVINLFDPIASRRYGAIEFPEGEPLVLNFSQSGRLLLAAGGKPVQNGAVVLFDVATGKRLASVGDEPDAIIAADISPDEKLVAIGCTSRLVKLYSTEDGSLKATMDKHTDWVTAVAFSPDGKYLATGDRIGNIHLWDGASGGVILPLSEHTKSVRALSWRSDSGVVASAGEDGTVVWWDVKDGWPLVSKPNAHAGGVLDCRFGPQGKLATCGRDAAVKIWSAEGKELTQFSVADKASVKGHSQPGIRVLPTRVTIAQDGSTVVAGDITGHLHKWQVP